MVATGKQKHDRTSCKSVAVQQLGIGELAELPICRVTIVHLWVSRNMQSGRSRYT